MISMNKNKTKIVATLGPVSRDEKIIEELILAGANVFRINTSHNTAEEHKQKSQSSDFYRNDSV